jgi:hypothetical protein
MVKPIEGTVLNQDSGTYYTSLVVPGGAKITLQACNLAAGVSIHSVPSLFMPLSVAYTHSRLICWSVSVFYSA